MSDYLEILGIPYCGRQYVNLAHLAVYLCAPCNISADLRQFRLRIVRY